MEALIKSVVGFVMAVMAIAGGLTGFYWIGIICGLGGAGFGIWSVVDVLTEMSALKAKRPPAVRKESVVELDFSAKQARRKAEDLQWTVDFFDALGDERGKVLMSEWKEGSRRSVLAGQLKADHAAAEKAGRVRAAEQLMILWQAVSANPDQVLEDSLYNEVVRQRKWWIEKTPEVSVLLRAAAAPWRF